MPQAESLLSPDTALSPNTAVASPTPTASGKDKFFSWERPKLVRSGTSGGTNGSHRVTFSGSSKGSGRNSSNGQYDREHSSHSDSSRGPTPPPPTPQKANEPWMRSIEQERKWKKVERHGTISGAESSPPQPSRREDKPFLVYNDAFLPIIGPWPSLTCLIHDARGPYFKNSGMYSHRTGTLLVTSAPVADPSPAAAPSRNLGATITKIDFYSATDHARDKVRTPDHTYMPKSGCAWRDGFVLCAQGTYKEPAALIYMDAKRPHRHFPLLTNFNGIPLNSPHSATAHADGSIWFSDPHLAHVPSFRPKPRLPPMVYRFDPGSSDLRAMTSEMAHPSALEFSPDFKTLYILDGTPPATSQPAAVPLASNTPILWAYTVSGIGRNKAPFLTHKRLFAFTTSAPTSLAVDEDGNVFVGCLDGVHAFDTGGTLVGRIAIEGGASGLCFGKAGALWVSGGDKIWNVQLQGRQSGTA